MPKFHIRDFPPPGVRRHPNYADSNIAQPLKNELYLAFKRYIENPLSDTLTLTIPNEPPKDAVLATIGGTAMIARWLRDGAIEAFTLLLSDIDDGNDEMAMKTVEDELVSPNGEDCRPAIASLIDDVRHQPRPLSATIHIDETSYDNFTNHTCANLLTSAFCDHHGISDD